MSTPTATATAGRLFAAGAEADYRAHAATFGALDTLPPLDTARLSEQLGSSGLAGRGGAGFPAARKLAATRAGQPSRLSRGGAAVIANGAEGEPLSTKDAGLLRHAPHLVIDGLLIAASAVGATKLILYAKLDALPTVRRAIAERPDAAGIDLVEAPDTFISGEASAVVNAIESGVAVPRDRVVRLSASGFKRRPTLVHNVETLAYVALIARYGSAWFRSVGTELDPGTRLVTVTDAAGAAQLLEVPGGTTILEILHRCAVAPGDIGAVLVGGYHGAWIPADRLPGLTMSTEDLLPYGAQPGAGILHVLGRDECGLDATAGIVRYLADESARQCGPCQFGLPAIATMLGRIVSGDPDAGLRIATDSLAASVVGRGSCHHPDGTARLVRSTLRVFADDVDAHRSGLCLRRQVPLQQ